MHNDSATAVVSRGLVGESLAVFNIMLISTRTGQLKLIVCRLAVFCKLSTRLITVWPKIIVMHCLDQYLTPKQVLCTVLVFIYQMQQIVILSWWYTL